MITFSEVSKGRIIALPHIMTFVHSMTGGMVELSTGKAIPLNREECAQLVIDMKKANVVIHNCYREEK